MYRLKRMWCWWFGCVPGDLARHYYSDGSGCDDFYHCKRCGNEVDYGDLVGDTRHNRFKENMNYYLFRKWFPAKCPDCGRRYGHDESIDHIPF